jgi:NADH dehydrogenase
MAMQGLVTVFGGSGFVGRYAVRALAKKGWRIRVAVREPHLAPELKVMGDVGQVELVQANVRHEASVQAALVGAQACVNLVGVLYEAGRQSFEAVHATAPGLIASAATAAGATQFVQVSAIGADASSSAGYARTKAAGEAAVRAAFPSAVILRPSVVFGPEDGFFNRFGAMAAISPVLPLIGGGETKFQPVYVGDVGAAIVAALGQEAAAGRTFELGGPGVYSFKALLELLCRETMHKPLLLPIPFPVASLLGKIGDLQAKVPFAPAPQVTSDQVELLKSDNVANPDLPGLADLGVTATAIDAVIPTYLWRFRRGGQFAQPEASNA